MGVWVGLSQKAFLAFLSDWQPIFWLVRPLAGLLAGPSVHNVFVKFDSEGIEQCLVLSKCRLPVSVSIALVKRNGHRTNTDFENDWTVHSIISSLASSVL